MLNESDEKIREGLQNHYYRFQKSEDVVALFIALKRLNAVGTLEDIFVEAYKSKRSVIDGLNAVIVKLRALYPYNSRGYTFLLSKSNY